MILKKPVSTIPNRLKLNTVLSIYKHFLAPIFIFAPFSKQKFNAVCMALKLMQLQAQILLHLPISEKFSLNFDHHQREHLQMFFATQTKPLERSAGPKSASEGCSVSFKNSPWTINSPIFFWQHPIKAMRGKQIIDTWNNAWHSTDFK